jgi:hypothetical protein
MTPQNGSSMTARNLRGPALTALALGCLPSPVPEAAAPASPESRPVVADPSTSSPTTADGTPYVRKNVPILGGGFVTGVIFSTVEKDLVYARTDIGGAYRWEASSRTWIPLTDGSSREESNFMGIESLAIDPVDPNKVYLAVGTYVQEWANAGAIMRSSDRGKTWQV